MDVDINFDELMEFQQQIDDLGRPEYLEPAMQSIVVRLGAIYLREAKQKTPVGPRSIKMIVGQKDGKPIYKTHYTNTQMMRNSWHMGNPFMHDGNQKTGCTMSVEVFNTSKYSSFVNDGHRAKVGQYLPWLGLDPTTGIAKGGRIKTSWVEGQHMAEHAAKIVDDNSANIIRNGVNAYIRGVLHGN